MANMKNLWEHALKTGPTICDVPQFAFPIFESGWWIKEGQAPQEGWRTILFFPMRSMEHAGARLTQWQAHSTRKRPLTVFIYTVDKLGNDFSITHLQSITGCDIFGTLWQALDFLKIDLPSVQDKIAEHQEKGTYEDRYVRLSAEFLHETDKATLLKIGDQKIWFPKSQIARWYDVFFATRWLLDQKGIPYQRIHAHMYVA